MTAAGGASCARATVIGDGGEGSGQLHEVRMALAESEGRLSAQRRGETAAAEGSAEGIEADLITESDGGGGAALKESLHGSDGAAGVSDRLTISTPLAEGAHKAADHGLFVVERAVNHGGIRDLRLAR
jgi:hypothetical protein